MDENPVQETQPILETPVQAPEQLKEIPKEISPNSDDRIVFDCAFQGSEAGGQVLRTALTISTLLSKPIEIINIRQNRPNPGLQAQHLTAVKLLATLTSAKLEKAEMNSTSLFFSPKKIHGGDYNINIGTAGSVTLLLQTIMVPLLFCNEKISLRIIGGTDVKFAPSVNYLKEVFLPIANKIGSRFDLRIVKRGYFPKGQGTVLFESLPAKLPLKAINFQGHQELDFVRIFSHSCGLPRDVVVNQARGAKKILNSLSCDVVEELDSKEFKDAVGSGIDIVGFFKEGNRFGVNELGERGVDSLTVGANAGQKFLKELQTGKPVDSHLADQLIPFMALAKGKSIFETTEITPHTLTNIAVCEKLLGVKFNVLGNKGEPGTIFCQGLSFSK
ncbi:MAG: RNA 3'-terminal phosphate cyclase [Candidatus Diapherotrites archaeon]|nr:RNA 3'-terminal phosphate cyclase [Candidatus Diapherotrites archaeon]